jgi:hypothetical protein
VSRHKDECFFGERIPMAMLVSALYLYLDRRQHSSLKMDYDGPHTILRLELT